MIYYYIPVTKTIKSDLKFKLILVQTLLEILYNFIISISLRYCAKFDA